MQACRPLLGTYVEIRLDHPDPQRARSALEAAFAAIARVQALMSLREPESDLSRINRQAHREPVAVDAWTYAVLEQALAIHRVSDGIFECNVARRLAAWGLLPPELAAEAEQEPATMADLQLHDDNRVSARRPLALDLGGIAKGFAVDQAAEALLVAGVTAAVVNAGGDMRIVGEAEEAIQVRSAANPAMLSTVGMLKDGAFATSGSYFSAPLATTPGKSALVDPRNGEALLSDQSYSVVAPTCAVADGLTKVLAVTGDAAHPCFGAFDAHPLIL